MNYQSSYQLPELNMETPVKDGNVDRHEIRNKYRRRPFLVTV